MDWFDAMQCCYYQVLRPSDQICFVSFLQHGYVAEPLSQEEHDQIAQYLTICAYLHSINFHLKLWFPKENMWEPIRLRELNPQQTEVTSRTPGGLVGQIYIMRFDLKSFTIADTKVIMIQKPHNYIQGSWIWMSGAPWSFAPWGEGE